MEKKESYFVIDGVRYDAVKFEYGTTRTCKDCAFFCLGECTLPNIDGLFVNCNGDYFFVSRGEVAAQQRLTERSEKELDLDNPIGFSNAKLNTLGPPPEPDKVDKEPDEKEAARASNVNIIVTDKEGKDLSITGALIAGEVKRPGAIGKRSYYSFPNGVEAEDICRYLPFNLGNVVKYVCRAGRKDPKKKELDLQKAKDYLENEIKRMEEEDND